MEYQEISTTIIDAWKKVSTYIACGHENEFIGKKKETLVFRELKKNIERVCPELEIIGPDIQERFQAWKIDLVCCWKDYKIAIEGKYKIVSDGAVPDNRKAAFYDIFKLEQYVASSEYSKGLFLWLTNKLSYLKEASGDSIDFSTHNGRLYEPGEQLKARRARGSNLPIPLILKGRYIFNWKRVIPGAEWYNLVLEVC